MIDGTVLRRRRLRAAAFGVSLAVVFFASACTSIAQDIQKAVADAAAAENPNGPPPPTQPVGKPANFPAPHFDAPPRLAISAKELADLKASPGFDKIKAAAVKAGDALIEKPVPLPDGPGSWIFYYCNPDNGHTLVPISPTEHKDPSTGKIFTDERTVAAYRGIMQSNLESASVTLGWAYAYTGDDKYALASLRIFLMLANDYDKYPKRLDRWGHTGWLAPLGARRMVQSLDEAYGMTRLAKGYDLVRTSKVFTDADRKHIEDDFFRLTADTLLCFNQDVNNHQTWYDAGLMCIANVLADAKLVDRVLTMRGGYFDQLNRSIGRDGLWYEGTNAYHNYALQALIEEVEAGEHLGLPMHDQPKFKLMFEAPIRAAYPNGQVPAINDSDPGNIDMFTGSWVWAWKHFHDPFFAQAIAKGDQAKLDEMLGPPGRAHWGAGDGPRGAVPHEGPAPVIKAQWPVKMQSEALEDAGLAVLRMGEGVDATCAFIDYGPHGGGHGHFDKLNLMLFANNREWLLDPGRISYQNKEYKTWVKTTAAHNTVAIGGRSQQGTTGKLLYLQQADDFAAAVTECDTAYLATHLRRHVLLTKGFLVDIFDVKADGQNQIDLLAHAVAQKVEPVTPGLPDAKPAALGDDNGYQHLTSGAARKIDGDSVWDYIDGKLKLRVHLIGSPGETDFTCNGIGYNVPMMTPTIVRRRNTDATQFIAVYDLSGDGTGVTKVTQLNGETPGVTVETPKGTFVVAFGPTAATMKKQ